MQCIEYNSAPVNFGFGDSLPEAVAPVLAVPLSGVVADAVSDFAAVGAVSTPARQLMHGNILTDNAMTMAGNALCLRVECF